MKQFVVPVKADKSEKVLEDNKITQKTDSVNNDTVANKNETTVSQNLPASAAKLNLQNDETPINEPFGTDTGNSPVAVIPESSANNSLRNRDSAAQDSLRISTRAADNSEISVSSWNDLVTAVNNPNISKANITGNLNATSNLVIPANRMIEIDGGNLNLGSYQINPGNNSVTEFSNLKLTGDNKKGIVATDNSAVVSFNNVSHTGSDLVNAKNVDVVIKGDTNSTVTSAKERIGFNPEANIYAKNLEVAKDSSLTIDRNASQGDLIHLADGGKIEVKDNASLNATLDGQRRDAVVRVTNNGAFVTGAHSTVDLKTHNSRGIVLGQGLTGELPAGNSDSYAKSLINKNPSNELTLGNYTTFNFNGREAVLIGHNGKFNSGESSNITFNNKGDGVAFDMGDEGHFTVQPHAVLHLNSTGKKNSGNWEYSNYIGLDNNGQIRIEHDSEVYVDLKDRGTHPYNDTININSTKPGSKPYFYVGDNATLDVQDSSPDYYAELISVPLGGCNDGTFEFDQVKYLNLQKHKDIIGHNGNGNLIFMDTNNGKFIAHGPFIAKQWDNKVYQESPSNTWQPVEDINIPWRNFTASGKIEGILYGNDSEPISNTGKDFSKKFNPNASQRIVLQGIKIPAEFINRKVEAIPFETEKVFNPNLGVDEEIIQQEGKLGEKEIIKKSYTLDGKPDPNKPDVTETNILKNPVNKIVEYGPKAGTPEVAKAPIPFETVCTFDPAMPVGSADKTVQEGTEGEKTITTPVTVNPLTGDVLGKGTPTEAVTKAPVNKEVHFAPVAVPFGNKDVFDATVPEGQKVVEPGKEGKKNPETNEVIEQPKDSVTKYGPKAGTPEVAKAPIPFETVRTFDPAMPVGSADKTVQEGTEGEKTITTPVTVNPLTGEVVSKGTPTEAVTKAPVNKEVHVAPKLIPHKTKDIFDPNLPAGQTEIIPGEDGIENPITGEIIKAPKDTIVKHGTQPENATYEPVPEEITKPFGTPTTADEVKDHVKVPDFPKDGDQPKVTIDDPTQVPDGRTPGVYDVPVTVTYPDGTTDQTTVKITVGKQPNNAKYEPVPKEITKAFGTPTNEDEVKGHVKVPDYPADKGQPKVTIDDPTQVPDGRTPGVYDVPVTVTYPDGTKDHTKVQVKVNPQADTDIYAPNYNDVEVNPGKSVEIPQTGDKVPTGTTFEIPNTSGLEKGWKATIDPITGTVKVTAPKNASEGDTATVNVLVHYPDGTTDNVKVHVTVHDSIAPEAPVVDPIRTGSNTVSGKAVPGTKVTVTFPNGSTVTTQVDSNGNYTVKVPNNVTLKTGDKVVAVAIDDAGNVSDATTTVVQPNKTGMPTSKGSKVNPQSSVTSTTKHNLSKTNKKTEDTANQKTKSKALPETGEANTNSGLLAGTLFALLGSTFLFRRRRNHDDDK